MAMFFFRLKHGSRAGGRSAYSHMLYLLREAQYEYRLDELRHVEHVNMPEWAKDDPREFWRAADQFERQNGRLYTEFEVALPRELSKEQQFTLVQDFVHQTLGCRHPYTLVIHESQALDGREHPHFHLMFSTRTLDGIDRTPDLFFSRANAQEPHRGGAQKDLCWYSKERLAELRQAWEQQANVSLKRAGLEVQIDRRTLEAQGIHRQPEPVLGPYYSMLLKQGVITERAHQVLELREQRRLQEELAHRRAAQEEAKQKLRDLHTYDRLQEEYQALVTAKEQLEVERTRYENTITSLETYIRDHAPQNYHQAIEQASHHLWGRVQGVYQEKVQIAQARLEQFEQSHQGWWQNLNPHVHWERHELKTALREAERQYEAFVARCMARQQERDALAEKLWHTGREAHKRLAQYQGALEQTQADLHTLEHRVEQTFVQLTHTVEQLYEQGVTFEPDLNLFQMDQILAAGQEEAMAVAAQSHRQQIEQGYER